MINLLTEHFGFFGLLILFVHLIGFLNAALAVFFVQTSQGAIAWGLCLLLFPWVSLPLFWIFGPRRFLSYRRKITAAHERFSEEGEALIRATKEIGANLPKEFQDDKLFFETLAQGAFTKGNSLELITEGAKYFEELFSEIRQAKDYLLLQFYIVRADAVGLQLAELLKSKVAEGVRIYFLYDQVGSYFLAEDYVASLRNSGVQMESFRTNRGLRNPFLLNFRNHRKICIADGKVALVGGSNIGVEYRDETTRFQRWRDTQIRVRGPGVQLIQASFARDWYWARGSLEKLNWEIERQEEDVALLPIPTGPAGVYDSGSLLLLNLLTMAQKRIWLTSPYLVPDEANLRALELASLRGLDVRILLPKISDHRVVALANSFYERKLVSAGVKVFRYIPGFMHQKVALIDDAVSLVGSMNIDNRSLYLNFELSTVIYDEPFAKKLEKVLEEDFESSTEVTKTKLDLEPLGYQLVTRCARLFSPIL